MGQGAKVTIDGIFGPDTEAALLRVANEGEAEITVTAKGGGKAQKKRSATEPEPEQKTDPPPTTGGSQATARPVALSDSAISDVGQDRLGFQPYVEAVAEFILAEQTRPPLALAINAPWGQGKTSFMNMLDQQLKRSAEGTTTRVATTWFNPWKYSEPEQIWAAFVAKVTSPRIRPPPTQGKPLTRREGHRRLPDSDETSMVQRARRRRIRYRQA
ncbi:MAG: hypothetical protein JJT88_15170 [Gammaproteobacteria bacterium]|nr:hypothetical protein [Gammaproteobacteria bacterium]